MKLKAELFVISDNANVSGDQKLSINGIFDQITVPALPAAHQKLYFVAVIKGEPNTDYQLAVEILPPLGTSEKYLKHEGPLRTGRNGRSNLIVEVPNLPLPIEGVYKVKITSGVEVVGELEFTVVKGINAVQGKVILN